MSVKTAWQWVGCCSTPCFHFPVSLQVLAAHCEAWISKFVGLLHSIAARQLASVYETIGQAADLGDKVRTCTRCKPKGLTSALRAASAMACHCSIAIVISCHHPGPQPHQSLLLQ